MDPIINETQINILLDTNIPSNSQISLTKNILHNSLLTNINSYSEYPFFSWWIPYPRDILVSMDYSKQVDFFFIKKDFIKILKETNEYQSYYKQIREIQLKDVKLQNKPLNEDTIFKIMQMNNIMLDKKDKNNNAKNNIMIMLSLLFPTTFPTSMNVTNTYDALFLNVTSKSSVSSIIPFLLNIGLGVKSTKQKYSYIKIPTEGICTVTNVVWLNDIYNHPEYKKIIFEFEKFQLWKDQEKLFLKNEIDNIMKLFNSKYILGKVWNKLLKKMSTLDENEIPTTNIYNRYNYISNYRSSANQVNYRDEFKKLKKLLQNKDEIINNNNYKELFNIKKHYNNLEVVLKTEMIVPNIDNLILDIEKIQVNNSIINKYLSTDSFIEIKPINKYKMTQEEQRLEQKIQKWKGYQKNIDFINLLKIFDKSKNESTNHLLQKTIDDFVSGYSKKDFELLLNPSNSKSSNVIELVETGLTVKKNDPVNNTIYVRMDLIIGEVNDSNKNSINCLYNNDYLGNELNILLNAKDKFWELDKNRFLFDLNKMKVISDVSNQSINQEKTNDQQKNNKYKSNTNTRRYDSNESQYDNNSSRYDNNIDSIYDRNYGSQYDINNPTYGGTKLKNVTRKKRNYTIAHLKCPSLDGRI